MISMILATDESGGIGYKNSLPWPKVKSDLQWQTRRSISWHEFTNRLLVIMIVEWSKSCITNNRGQRNSVAGTNVCHA